MSLILRKNNLPPLFCDLDQLKNVRRSASADACYFGRRFMPLRRDVADHSIRYDGACDQGRDEQNDRDS